MKPRAKGWGVKLREERQWRKQEARIKQQRLREEKDIQPFVYERPKQPKKKRSISNASIASSSSDQGENDSKASDANLSPQHDTPTPHRSSAQKDANKSSASAKLDRAICVHACLVQLTELDADYEDDDGFRRSREVGLALMRCAEDNSFYLLLYSPKTKKHYVAVCITRSVHLNVESNMRITFTTPKSRRHLQLDFFAPADLEALCCHFALVKDAIMSHSYEQGGVRAMVIQDLCPGVRDGRAVQIGDGVKIRYTLHRTNNTDPQRPCFDKGEEIGRWEPSGRFIVGEGALPLGIEQGVLGMSKKGVRILVIPPLLQSDAEVWGPHVPANATLCAILRLSSVRSKTEMKARSQRHEARSSSPNSSSSSSSSSRSRTVSNASVESNNSPRSLDVGSNRSVRFSGKNQVYSMDSGYDTDDREEAAAEGNWWEEGGTSASFEPSSRTSLDRTDKLPDNEPNNEQIPKTCPHPNDYDDINLPKNSSNSSNNNFANVGSNDTATLSAPGHDDQREHSDLDQASTESYIEPSIKQRMAKLSGAGSYGLGGLGQLASITQKLGRNNDSQPESLTQDDAPQRSSPTHTERTGTAQRTSSVLNEEDSIVTSLRANLAPTKRYTNRSNSDGQPRDINDLLRELELEEYIHVFEQEHLSLSDLILLDSSDLKELIPQLGPRRRLLYKARELASSLAADNAKSNQLSQSNSSNNESNFNSRRSVFENKSNSSHSPQSSRTSPSSTSSSSSYTSTSSYSPSISNAQSQPTKQQSQGDIEQLLADAYERGKNDTIEACKGRIEQVKEKAMVKIHELEEALENNEQAQDAVARASKLSETVSTLKAAARQRVRELEAEKDGMFEQYQNDVQRAKSIIKQLKEEKATALAEKVAFEEKSRLYVAQVRADRKEKTPSLVKDVMKRLYDSFSTQIGPNDLYDGQQVLDILRKTIRGETSSFLKSSV